MRKHRKQAALKACASVIEQLEKRSLLSAVVGSDGTLTVTGTEGADNISVSFNIAFLQRGGVAGSYSVAVNRTSYNFPAAGITRVVVNAEDGNDGVNINGKEEDDDSASAPVNVIVNEGNGNISVSSVLSEVGFFDQNHIPAPSVSVTAGNGNDNIFVTGSYVAIVSVGNGNDTLQASANSDDMLATFNAGNGNDEIDGVSAGNAGLSIEAHVGTGKDTFNTGNDPDLTVDGHTTDGQTLQARSNQIAITGRVNDGIGMSPVIGAEVYLDLDNDGMLDSNDPVCLTDGNGYYGFTFPVAGTSVATAYTVRMMSPGFSSSVSQTVTAKPSQGFSGLDFAPIATAADPVIFGTNGSYKNQGNTNANAVDENLSTYFDAPQASGGFVALDFGSVQNISQISYAPRVEYTNRMVGGLFQGSSSASFSNPVTLYKITAVPNAGVLTTVNVTGEYEYVRYIGSANSYCNIAEMQFTLAPVPGLATIANGILNITGTNGTDNLQLNFNSSTVGNLTLGTYSLNLNGQAVTVNATGITAININSKDGANDVVDVNGYTSSELESPAVPITINEGNGNDTVFASRNENGPNQSVVAVEPRFIIHVGNGNDSVTTSGAGLVTITAGNGDDTISVSSSSGQDLTASVMAGNGNDQVDAHAAMGAVLVTARMGSGHDEYAASQSFFGGSQINATTITGETPTVTGNGDLDFTGQILTTAGTGAPDEIVFADANNNEVLDLGETWTTTNSNGVYSLVVAPTNGKFTAQYYLRGMAQAGYNITPAVLQESFTPGWATSGDSFVLTQSASTANPVVFGTPGTYSNGNTIAKAVDGNWATYFDAPIATGAYVALDYGTPQLFSQVRYAPRPGYERRMIGGLFQGANSPDFSDAVTLYKITAAPPDDQFTLANLTNTGTYRYVRYIGPANSYCNIAEMLFTANAGLVLSQNGEVLITGTNGADRIGISYNLNVSAGTSAGFFYININGFTTDIDAGFTRGIEVDGLSGDDNINLTCLEINTGAATSPAADATIIDGNGNDTLSMRVDESGWGVGGTPPGYIVVAGDGNDTVTGMGGASATIDLGNGNDTVNASATKDPLSLVVQAGNGNDEINGIDAGGASLALQATVGTGLDSFITNNSAKIRIKAETSNGQAPDVYDNQVVLTGRVFTQSFANARAGATVFLDSNNNGILDPGELSTTTNAQGLYAFDVPVANASSPAITYNLRVEAPGYFSSTPLRQETGAAGTSFSGVDFALNPTITGTVIGTAGSYRSQGNTIANVFDQNLNTFFDGPDTNGDWVGLDLGSAKLLSTVNFAPRSAYASRMVGGEIQASNTANFGTGVVTLVTISTAPAYGQLTALTLSNTTAYRYYRYIGPANGFCNIAELVFGS